MTDNEIIKALECCINDDCDNCPDTFGNCEHNAMRNALDLINRQKAEIEELQTDGETLAISLLNARKEIERLKDRNVELWGENRVACKKAKSEAIKEFAERLKEKAYIDDGVTGFQDMIVAIEDIDTLVEEMTVNYESSKQRKE